MRRFLRFIGGVLLAIGGMFGLLLLLLYASRKTLIDWVLAEIGRSFSAQIQLRSIQLVTLHTFPNVGIRLYEPLFQSKRGDTLFSAQIVDLHFNLWEVLMRPTPYIRALTLIGPEVWIFYDRKGYSPWESVFDEKSQQTPSRKPSSMWALEKVRVRKGKLIYKDAKAGIHFCLFLARLEARVEGKGEELKIRGEGEGHIEYLKHHQGVWLRGQPFMIQGGLSQEEGWLVSSGLKLHLAGLALHLEGGIHTAVSPPELSLRIPSIELDLNYLHHWGIKVPVALAYSSGILRGEGTILGPAGRGKLPRLRLKAELSTDKPFSVEGYPFHRLYARGSLYWDLQMPAKSLLKIDTFFFAGGEHDTLRGRLTYGLLAPQLSSAFQAHIDLEALRFFSLPYGQNFSGKLSTQGEVSRDQKRWSISASGEMRKIRFPKGIIEEASFTMTPSQLNLQDLRLILETTQVHSPALRIQNYTRLWDTTAPPLHVTGKIFIPAFAYAPDTSQSSHLPWNGELEVKVETLYAMEQRYGPLHARFMKKNDTLKIDFLRLRGVGGGGLGGQGLFLPHLIYGEGEFDQIDLHQLSLQAPMLDTLFPLLRHLRGKANGRFRFSLPFQGEKLRWADAEAELTLKIRDLVVVESPYTYELFSIIPLTDFRRIEVGEVETRISLREGVIRTDTTWLRANRWIMRVSGAHTLQGELSYDLLVEVPRILLDKSPERTKALIEEAEGERVRLVVTVSGTTQKPLFHWKPARRVSPSKGRTPPLIEER
ncbi:MAG: hypothetical protein RMK19_05345 [Bacteroidia bacterium]|nr:hypothetical protein [Bacteroidia bacterium]MDW8015418.1 hypothetical protein [Bacteroidia bacterium]